jgi:hypothetical protein
VRECLVDGFADFQVGPREDYKYLQLPFYGLSDLPGSCRLVAQPCVKK